MLDEPKLVRLSDAGEFPKVKLAEPVHNGYLLLAGEIDYRAPFTYFMESSRKRELIEELKPKLKALQAVGLVEEASLLKAAVIPPGRGAYLERRPGAHIARYDVAIILRTRDVDTAMKLLHTDAFNELQTAFRRATDVVYRMVGENYRRIGDVDHGRKGVFLINYFLAARKLQNLAVWEYTAGWFQQETGLDNSILISPLDEVGATYSIINHCRWDRFRDILPSLLFKRSFQRYVLDHFRANDTAAMPILYRLA